MRFSNRRLLLQYEDVPISTPPQIQPTNTKTASSPSIPTIPSKTITSPLSLPLPLHPIFSSNVAYSFLLIFSIFFFAAFVILSIREVSSRRRRGIPPRRGLDPAAVKALPVCLYEEDTKQPDCAICLEEFRECEEVKMVPYCSHVFHPECIDAWLSAHVTCPICRCVIKVCGGSVDQNAGRSTVDNGS
ncbi:RING-H2 finger protein ATL57-like [Vicia villosa]|uniref:RING-H2 finger protein ATL57-like n=1 Tax=Vicia villosa TaxID=3911 RepID=UPI00273AE17E|nr:RING-H2 finger protein ATL57-like [Vicia villosa]